MSLSIASGIGRRAAFILSGLAAIGVMSVACLAPASSQQASPGAVLVPHFWDPQRRLERPDLSALRTIRFVTDDEYPPFAFPGPDGALAGFNVDLARALCEELKIPCTIQARRFDTIIDAVEQGQADAAIASLAATSATRARVDFTAPYYKTPGRFISPKDMTLDDVRPETLVGQRVGVVEGTAHAAFLETRFPRVERQEFADLPALIKALRSGETPLAFADGVTLAVWLNTEEGAACCAFRGGPFLDPLFFGDGVGVAVRKENAALRRALDFAFSRIAEQGVYTELYLKYFPVGFF
ncbi:MAG: transporter substrate-binding domain-containing protein [Beijerinckiaceae bacterium]|nr:transporter substrate-binding domain-containing protein [Beijerinckiaceae bacterium]